MPIPKGVRYGGRQKGTPNVTTQHLLEKLDDLGFDTVAKFIEAVEDPSVPPAQRAALLLKFLEFQLPKRAMKPEDPNPKAPKVPPALDVTPAALPTQDLLEIVASKKGNQ